MSVEALLGTDRAFAEDLIALRPQPGQAESAANLRRLLAGSEIVASHRDDDPARPGRLLAALRAAGERRRARRARPRRARSPRPSSRRRSTTRWSSPTAGSSRAATSTARRSASPATCSAIAVAQVGRDRRAPHRPPARREPLAGPAAVPRRRPGRRLGADDRPVHAGGDGRREPAARGSRRASTRCRPARCRRTTSRWPGARRASCAASVANLARIVAVELTLRGARPRPAGAAEPGGRHRRRRWRRCAAVAEARARPLARPGARRGRAAGRRRRAARRRRGLEAADPGAAHEPRGPGAARRRALLPRLAAGGGAADADEQPRPRGRRAARGPGRLRRHRPRGALVGRLRRDRAPRCASSADDETLLVQSGKPVGVFRTHEWAPRVLIANSNLVPDWANWEEFRRLEDLGLTMYGQMTAGSWIYIGSQGIVQGTYECFAEIARRRFGGSLAGTITLTAGLGGMGGAQPLAVTMNEGVALCVEVDPERIERRLETRYLDEQADDLDDAIARCEARQGERRALSVGLCANAADVLPELLRRGFDADIVTDQTSAHDPLVGYVPNTLTLAEADRLRRERPGRVRAPRAGGDRRPLLRDGRLQGRRRRGLRLRQQPARRGPARRLRARLRLPGLRPRLHPAAVLRGQGAVSLGRAVGRPGRHRRHRPRRARGVRRRRGARALDPARRRADRLPGPAGADLLARLRRAAPPRPALQRDGPQRRAEGADRDRPRPPRLGLGRLALPRDRGDGRRLGRDRRLAAAERARQHLRRRLLGEHPPRRRGRHRALDPRRDGLRRRRHRPRGAEARAGPDRDPGTGVIRHADAGYERALEVAAERGVRIPMRDTRRHATHEKHGTGGERSRDRHDRRPGAARARPRGHARGAALDRDPGADRRPDRDDARGRRRRAGRQPGRRDAAGRGGRGRRSQPALPLQAADPADGDRQPRDRAARRARRLRDQRGLPLDPRPARRASSAMSRSGCATSTATASEHEEVQPRADRRHLPARGRPPRRGPDRRSRRPAHASRPGSSSSATGARRSSSGSPQLAERVGS